MILFINTADLNNVSLSLIEKDKVFKNIIFAAKYRQSEMLLPAVKKLLTQTNGRLAKPKTIVAVTGPGPFTALRVGIAAANTLAFAWQLPISGVKLNQLANGSNFGEFISRQAKKAKFGAILEPHYGAEPNITLKKNK